ncbi:MAG: hypothetical protein KGM44_03060 [bacterium]|nr:hypothetical protein [bacterium]
MLLAAAVLAIATASPGMIAYEARARSAGNRRVEAVAVAERLLSAPHLASIVKVRVDAAGGLAPVAGILLSGVKLHARAVPGWGSMLREADRLAAQAFAADATLAEVDIWAAVPLNLAVGTKFVSGDLAVPDSAIVFTRTQQRGGAAHLWWDAAWRSREFSAR